MLNVLWCLIVSFITTYISMPVIIHIAEVKRLFDIPDNRKVHATPIPALGGVGIFGGFMFASLLCISFNNSLDFQFDLAAGIVLFFIGLKDDLLVISPSKKFIGQLLAAFLVVVPGQLQFTDLNGLFGIHQLTYVPYVLLSMLVILMVINAFNLIDGLDGLAGSLGIVSCALMGMYFINNHIYNYAVLAFAMCGSIVAFLSFNFQPARIFMGDTGSLLIGLVNAILVVKMTSGTQSTNLFGIEANAALGLALLFVPVMDIIRVSIMRVINGRSPFKADKNHIHHILLAKGFNHNQVVLILLLTQSFSYFLVYVGQGMSPSWLILFMVCIYFGGIQFIKGISFTNSKASTPIKEKEVQGVIHTLHDQPALAK